MYTHTPPPCLLADRTIFITGAGQGIGKALAIGCATLGARVIILGRSVKKLQYVSELVVDQGLPNPIIIPFDLEHASEDDYQTLYTILSEQITHLDGLVNNASVAADLKPFTQLSNNEFNRVMHINVNASFALTKTLFPLLDKAPESSIIFTSSSVGRMGRANWSAYATSKFATEGLMQCLADELQHTNVRVNSVNPGATRTEMRAQIYPDEVVTNNPLPEQILPIYFYLLGPDSNKVNGQAFNAQ